MYTFPVWVFWHECCLNKSSLNRKYMNGIEQKFRALVEGYTAHELAKILGISYNGAKKKLVKGNYTLEDLVKIARSRGKNDIMFTYNRDMY